jgi:hypothetical protein
MEKRFPNMKWIVCDVYKMDQMFDNCSFDCAIDKGTLDAFLTTKHDPWDPPVNIISDIKTYVNQVAMILKKGGTFIHVTFAQPVII